MNLQFSLLSEVTAVVLLLSLFFWYLLSFWNNMLQMLLKPPWTPGFAVCPRLADQNIATS